MKISRKYPIFYAVTIAFWVLSFGGVANAADPESGAMGIIEGYKELDITMHKINKIMTGSGDKAQELENLRSSISIMRKKYAYNGHMHFESNIEIFNNHLKDLVAIMTKNPDAQLSMEGLLVRMDNAWKLHREHHASKSMKKVITEAQVQEMQEEAEQVLKELGDKISELQAQQAQNSQE